MQLQQGENMGFLKKISVLALVAFLYNSSAWAQETKETKESLKVKCDITADDVMDVAGKEACKSTVTSWPKLVSDARLACQELRFCKQAARGDKRECKDDCKDIVKQCKDECKSLSGKDKNRCNKACNQSKKICKTGCKADKKQAKQDCMREFKTQECVDARSAIWGAIPDTAVCIAHLAKACKSETAEEPVPETPAPQE